VVPLKVKLNARVDSQVKTRLRRYMILRWGESESLFGKISEVTEQALTEFLDRELPKLEKTGAEEESR